MSLMTLGCVGFVLAITASGVSRQVETFVNDFEGWAEATGPFSTIDFETLPDGSPSDSSVEINALFNYTNQGATFSSPFDDLFIAGNEDKGFSLRGRGDGMIGSPEFIRADLTGPARSVGFFFPGSATFEAFDEEGELLASAFFGSSGEGFFLGLTSDMPIAYLIMDENAIGSDIQSFHFASVPEPGTAGLLGLGGLAVFWGHRARGRAGSRGRRRRRRMG